MAEERTHREYLGDGVYASFDGYQIWLAVNHHENDLIAIEPPVMNALLRYANRIWPQPQGVEAQS